REIERAQIPWIDELAAHVETRVADLACCIDRDARIIDTDRTPARVSRRRKAERRAGCELAVRAYPNNRREASRCAEAAIQLCGTEAAETRRIEAPQLRAHIEDMLGHTADRAARIGKRVAGPD